MKYRTPLSLVTATASVGALAVSAVALIGTGSTAATAELPYSCKIPILGAKTFKVTLDTDAPATAPVGSKIANLSVNVVPDPSALKTAYSLGARQFEGETTFNVAVGGTNYAVKATTPRSDIAADGSVPPTNATLPLGATLPTAGTIKVTAGKIDIHQKVYDKDGKPFSLSPEAQIPCTPPASGDLTVDSVVVGSGGPTTPPTKPPTTTPTPKPPVVKVATRTSVKAKFVRKGTVKVTVAVKGGKPTGKVKITLKGKKKVTKKAVLRNGKATVTVKKLKKGKYKVSAAYAGNATTKASSKTVRVKVRK